MTPDDELRLQLLQVRLDTTSLPSSDFRLAVGLWLKSGLLLRCIASVEDAPEMLP